MVNLCFNADRRIGGVEHEARSAEVSDENIRAEVSAVEDDLAGLSVGGDTSHNSVVTLCEGQFLEVDEVVGEKVSTTIQDVSISVTLTGKKKSGAVAVISVQSVHRDISNLKGVFDCGARIHILSYLPLPPKRICRSQVATRVESELYRVALLKSSNSRGIVVSREGDCSDSVKAVGVNVSPN